MLKPAQLYAEELQKKNYETWYDKRYMYYGGLGACDIELADNNCDKHQFVSVDKDNNVIGYISYKIDWCALNADNFGIISYDMGNFQFLRDCYQVVCDLFKKYHMNRVGWFAYVDNPAIRGYRNFVKKHGGKECAYLRQIAKLADGKLHDAVEFEILAEEFIR